MSVSLHDTSQTSFCSRITAEKSVDPIGSAPVYDGFLVVEFPLPWKREVTDSPHWATQLQQVVDESKRQGTNIRLQGVVPQRDSTGETVRVLFFRQDEKQRHVQFVKEEYDVPHTRLLPLVRSLLLNEGEHGEFSSYTVQNEYVRDLLVCTHGARDSCCGKFGYDIFQKLRQYCTDHPQHNVRVWRSSHLGGHRFAPTILDLPTGQYWGNVTDDVLPELVTRSEHHERLRPYYRGWTMLASAHEQVAEGELFERVGWQLFSFPRTAHISASNEEANESVVHIRWHDTVQDRRLEARVKVGQTRVYHVPPSCGDKEEPLPEYGVLESNITSSSS